MASQKLKKSLAKTPEQKKIVKRRKRGKTARRFLYAMMTLGTIGALTAIIVGAYMLQSIISFRNQPAVLNLDKEKSQQSQTSFIYAYDKDKKPVEIAQLHGTENRIWVDYDKIPEVMRQATISLEDKRFEKHNGVDWIRTIGAVAKYQMTQGGSTLTQQLIKNLTNEKDATLVRKYKEIVTALNLEKHYTKVRILEAYLNTLYLGNGCYGVRTAAETYFGKDVEDLNLAESAALVGITQFPSKHDPLRNPEANKKRQEYCLGQMLEQGVISQAEYDEAKNYKLIFTNNPKYKPDAKRQEQKAAREKNVINSFYVDFVIESVIEDLMAAQEITRSQAVNKIYYGGLKIYAAVDLEAQKQMEDVYVNRTNFPGSSEAVKPQSAMTVMDYQGRVVALVGQAGKKTQNRGLNRAVDSFRQPGSTIKPLSAYAPAFDLNHIRWTSTVRDYAIMIYGKQQPKNENGTPGSGANVTLTKAIQISYNTVPYRLIQQMGVANSYDYMKNKFHMSKLDDKRDKDYAPLGVGALTYGVSTLEMAAAYAAFGNNGQYYKPYCYYEVLDGTKADETILSNLAPQGEQILSASTADIMQELLKTVPVAKHNAPMGNLNKFEIMAKTGTTTSNHDRWFCMGTPYYVSATWYGYDKEKNIPQTGTNPAAKIALTVQNRLHKDLAEKKFVKSKDTVERRVCNASNLLAGSNCGSTSKGWFDAKKLPGSCGKCSAAPAETTPVQGAVDAVRGEVSQAVDNGMSALHGLLD